MVTSGEMKATIPQINTQTEIIIENANINPLVLNAKILITFTTANVVQVMPMAMDIPLELCVGYIINKIPRANKMVEMSKYPHLNFFIDSKNFIDHPP